MKKLLRVSFITILVLAVLSAAGILVCLYFLDSEVKKAEAGDYVTLGLGSDLLYFYDALPRTDDFEKAVSSGISEAISVKERLEEEARLKREQEEREARERALLEARARDNNWEDLKAPVFLYFRGSPEIKLGNSFDIHKYIGYGDDVDRDVDLKVQGSVDTSTEGVYPLKITLTDDAGRSTVKNMEVHVVASSSSSGGGEGNKEAFADFVANYKTSETLVGIDVSRWQETIDFEKVKAAGCEFVYMRLGGYDNGELFTDRCFLQNIAGAKAQGLKIGIYWYGEESSPEEVKESVKYLMSVLGGEALDFPIAYDWEDYRNFETHGMNLHDLNIRYDDFEREVEKYGYTACLYGSKNAQINIWTHEKKNPVWLAQYNSTCTYEGNYFMWQHSNTGRIDGIAGDVDLDIYYLP
ncbi:MAG: hypothetical protein J6U37_03620 [Lachnospiraceae bacterium]|nr:hypothetical protein [Lachnospiraceae bacterium]